MGLVGCLPMVPVQLRHRFADALHFSTLRRLIPHPRHAATTIGSGAGLLRTCHLIHHPGEAIRKHECKNEDADASRHSLWEVVVVRPPLDEVAGDEERDGGDDKAQHGRSVVHSMRSGGVIAIRALRASRPARRNLNSPQMTTFAPTRSFGKRVLSLTYRPYCDWVAWSCPAA